MGRELFPFFCSISTEFVDENKAPNPEGEYVRIRVNGQELYLPETDAFGLGAEIEYLFSVKYGDDCAPANDAGNFLQ